MSDRSLIEWTDATWNPVSGCTKITAGCDNCYAERFSERFRGVKIATKSGPREHYYYNGFDLTLHPEHLDRPARWTRPRMIFVCSMGDLFHRNIPAGYLDRIFEVMERADHHIYQVLTKRSPRMRNYMRRRYAGREAPAHIWCGVSIENADSFARVRHLKETPAAVRFLSCEPLIGPIANIALVQRDSRGNIVPPDERLDLNGIHWVIAGGESGPGARPMHPQWAGELRVQCTLESVPFFFKQWGEWAPAMQEWHDLEFWRKWRSAGEPHTDPWCLLTVDGERSETFTDRGEALLYRHGKKKAGRRLYGQIHDGFPRAGARLQAA